MTPLDFPPARFEVEDQLNRILASARFKNATNPSDFLSLGVKRALKGQKTTGSVIAKALFGEKYFSGLSSDVRVTAKNLRRTLAGYYAKEGKADVVIISYPTPPKDKSIKLVEGEAYTPAFSYNPEHEAYMQVRLGYRLLEQSTYGHHRRAFAIFSTMLDEAPDNIGGIFGMIETICKFADRHWDYPVQLDAPLTACMRLFDQVEERAKHYWRFWATKAYLHKGAGKEGLIAACYAKALAIDQTATESYLPYIEFLFDSGKLDDGLGLAQRYVNERVEDATAVAQYGLILCTVGRQSIGIGHLQAALAMDPGNTTAHEGLAVARFVQRDLDATWRHLRALRALCDEESFQWIVKFFEAAEDRYAAKGCVAKWLSGEVSAASVAIVKP